MRTLIRLLFTLVFLILAVLNVFAAKESVNPVAPVTISFHHIKKLDLLLSASLTLLSKPETAKSLPDATESTSGSRICSGQILHLESSNYKEPAVAVLTETTSRGSADDFSAAKNRIQKEKKLMKQLL